MEAELSLLAAASEGLGPRAPPALQQALEDRQATVRPVELRARASGDAAAVEITTDLVGEAPPGTEVVVEAQVGDEAPRRGLGAITLRPAPPSVAYWARAVHASGLALASVGTPTAPLRWEIPPPGSAGEEGPNEEDEGLEAWPFLVGGGVAAATGLVVLLVVLTSSSPDHRVAPPAFPEGVM